MTAAVQQCACGDDDPNGCLHLACGYPWCRPCGEHHRPPECDVDSNGRSLASCGCAWDDLDRPDYRCTHYDE